ncbi:AAA family ATPase [Methanorbis rubei]|uniref:RecF/RecN/SMC N-terminal domain-containing protein n=1 Tax=Methanorbis rubei TaxID=3028300 RepID=A0AAE4MIF1_9EURY|nr:hypothetical protein [Methanocorpusculaceae archaeon Cs1]
MLEKIEIHGLRHFEKYCVEADGLTVFFGKNGTGKSSIVTAFRLLAAVAGRSLADWTEVFSNTGALFHFGPEETKEITLSVKRGRESYTAALALDPKDASRLILRREKLIVADHKDPTQFETTEVKTCERESIFGVPMDGKESEVYPLMREMNRWWIGSLLPSAIRSHEINDTGRVLYPTGKNLEACLIYLAENYPDAFEKIRQALSEVEPEFIRFVVIKEGAEKSLRWESQKRPMLIPVQYLSEGTLRLLCYAVLFVSEDLPEVIVIDDIETALDEDHISALMRLAADAGRRTNIILTTRSEAVAGYAGSALRQI